MQANGTIGDQIRKSLITGKFQWILLSLCSMVMWVFYLTFWNSRLIGLILTFILRRFTSYNIKIGSVSLSVLGGKLMLRDFYIVNKDYSFRSFYIVIIFNFWKPYEINKKDESDRSLTIYAFKPEIHLFNRTAVYDDLLKVVANVAEKRRLLTMANVKSSIGKRSNYMKQKSMTHEMTEYSCIKEKPAESSQWFDWQLLFPKITLSLEALTICFGNHLLPTTFSVKSEKAVIIYSTRPATYSIDKYQHLVSAKCTSFVASLIPTINHKKSIHNRSKLKENQNCQILSFGKSKFLFEMDEPGEVTLEPEQLQMTNGNIEVLKTWPKYTLNIEVIKDCKVSYNAWADSQRDVLWKFFFPQDFTTAKVTQMPGVGSNRIHKSFDINFKSNNNTKLEITFNKQRLEFETNFKCFVDINIPWLVSEAGYTSTIQGSIPRSSCSLSHLSSDFLITEDLTFNVQMHYPRVWNVVQMWNFDINLSKAKCKLVYDYKNFFMGLINEWASDEYADLCKFVPFVYDFKVDLKDSLFMLYANDYNWIAPSDENAFVAFRAQQALLHITMPFIDFLPDKIPYHIQLNAANVACQLSLPETSTSLYITKELHSHMRIVDRDCKPLPNDDLFKITTEYVKGQENKPINKRRKFHWIDCIFAPEVNIDIVYFHHSMHKIKNFWEFMPPEMMNLALLTKHPSVPLDEDPLNSLRPEGQLQTGPTLDFLKSSKFDASYMESDLLELNVKVSSGTICLYGSLLRHVLHIKENYFGENQVPTDFSGLQVTAAQQAEIIRSKASNTIIIDPREYRPFAAKINLSVHNIQGHLMKHSSSDGTFCPTVFINCIGFEMDKGHVETKLQVLISPILIVVFDSYQGRRDVVMPLNRGTLVMESLQVRGHAMFTDGIIEYGWLIEATLGEITGQCTVQQVNTLVHCIQCLVFLITDVENEVLPSRDFEYCQHLWPKTECPEWQYKHRCLCPNEADLKYKLLRILFDGLHINIVEDSTCLALKVAGPVYLVNCNLHGSTTKEGISATLPEFSVKQYIKPIADKIGSDTWIEAGSLSLGDVVLNAGIALPMLDYRSWQDKFLKYHDGKTKRLWFLWNDLDRDEQDMSFVCGCVGGCAFFGENFLNNRYSRSSEDILNTNEKAAAFVNRQLLGKTRLLTFGESMFEEGKWIFERHTSDNCCEITSGWILLREKKEREEIINLHNSSTSVSNSNEGLEIEMPEDEEPILNHSQTLSETQSIDNDSQIPIFDNEPNKLRRKFSLKSLISCASSKSTSKSVHSHLSVGDSDDEKRFMNKAYQYYNEGEDEESSGELRAKYVDLRGQLHKSITESNLLYSAYKRHLAIYSCNHWAVPVTIRHYWTKYHSDRLALFQCTQEGFTPKLIVMRTHSKRHHRVNPKTEMDYVSVCPKKFPDHESLDSGSSDLTAKTTVSIKFNNAINILLTPLFVECMTRYVTILTPELSHSFTSTVVNRLHFQSVQLTQDRCKPMKGTASDPDSMLSTKCASLKHNKSKDGINKDHEPHTNSSENVFESASHWVQRKVTSVLVPNISGLTPLMEENALIDQKKSDYTAINMEDIPMTPLAAKDCPDGAVDPNFDSVGLTSPTAGELTRVSRTQFSVTIGRINVCVMQLYAIEDIVNSDTLVSGLHDLTCVSLMSLCLDTASFQLLINTQSEAIQGSDTLIRALRELKKSRAKQNLKNCDITMPNLNTRKLGAVTLDSVSTNNIQDNDGFRKTEEIIANIEVKRVHGQLRRLTRDSQFSSDVLLTAIPFNTSKVFFAFESDPGGPLSNCVRLDERSAGWIMFECGLENLILKGVRKRGFPDSVDDYSKKISEEDDSTEHSSENDENDDGTRLGDSQIRSRASRNAMITHLQVRTLWLNFPAPKKLPNKKRINITRDDWNLLSTATPMIKAWMDPFYRLVRTCDKLKQLTERRQLAVLACLMTQISHVDISHFSNIMFGHCDKSFNFYDKWRTSLARAIRYEPTCQIFTLIRMYLQSDPNLIMEIERSLKDDTLPQTVTLQRGILALTRHWQHLVEVDPQLKISRFQNMNDINNFNHMHVGSIQKICTPSGLIHVPTANSQLYHFNPEEPCINKSPVSDDNHDIENQDIENVNVENPIMQRFLQDANKASSSKFMKDLNENSPGSVDFQLDPQDELEENFPITTPLVQQPQNQNQFSSNDNNAAFVTNQFKQANFLRAHFRYMEEAQKVFRPLLEIVGLHVKGVRRTTLMKKFGGYFGATGLLDSFRIDIIPSESNPLAQYNQQSVDVDANNRASDQLSSLPKMMDYSLRFKASRPLLNRSTFLCQGFSTKITMRDVIGFEETKDLNETINELDIKPTTTQIFVILQIQDIQQHINMPLLRLVHQFVTMVYCANDAREDIDNRRQNDWPPMYSRRHQKQNSKGSSNDTVTTGETGNSSNEAKAQENYYSTLQTNAKSDSVKNIGKDEEFGFHSDVLVDVDQEDIPICWRQMYSLLDLYSRVPELKTVKQPTSSSNILLNLNRRSFSLQGNTFNMPTLIGSHMPTIKEEINETSTHNGSRSSLKPSSSRTPQIHSTKKHLDSDSRITMSLANQAGSLKSFPNETHHPKGQDTTDRGQVAIQKFTFQWVHGERVPLVIFCSGKVKKMGLSAVLSELNLEGKLLNLHCSYSQKSRVKGRGMFTDKSSDHSFSLHCGELETVLFEEIPTQKLDVVHIKGSPSHFVYSSNRKKKSEKNSCFFGLGKFDIGLPHHPVKLKDMMQRSAKRISSTMTEFFRPYSTMSNYHSHPQFWEGGGSSGAGGPGDKSNDLGQPAFESVALFMSSLNSTQPRDFIDSKTTGPIIDHPNKNPVPLKQIHMIITGMSKGLTISVALHQSLTARYQLEPVYMNGKIAADDSKLNVSIKNHYLSFISENPPPGVPKSVSIMLPKISTQVSKKFSNGGKFLLNQGKLTQDLITEEGSYIDVLASVSTLEHTLATSLLSYIVVTVQLFVKEINEVIQKMAGEDQIKLSAQANDEFNKSFSTDNKLLNRAARGNTKFSFRVSMDGIRLIATTKSGAVKFETQQIDIELSNRVHSSHGEIKFKTASMDSRHRRSSDKAKRPDNVVPDSELNLNSFVNENSKDSIFVFTIIENISVELGQLCNDIVYAEKPPDFKTLAFFKTGISLRSLLTEETALRLSNENREAYLISLIRPIFWIKPVAFDRGLLMWKLYKEEFEKWKKAMTLHSQACTPNGSLPSHHSRSHSTLQQETTPSSGSTSHGHTIYQSNTKQDILFLQLMIDDLGICIPLCPASYTCTDYDPRTNMVVTLKNARLSSCFKQDFASEGEFINFCIRFDEEFNVGADDWKPDIQRFLVSHKGKDQLVVINGCVVPNGTFQVCSKLKNGDITKGIQLDVIWKMCGLDTHLDWNIGRRLKTLSIILTSMINLKDTDGEEQLRSQNMSPRMHNVKSDCILLQGQPTKLFDSPHEHINLNSLTEILDDVVDHPNYNLSHRKSLDLHKSKRPKLTQFFAKPKHNSIKRSGSLSTNRFYSSYPSPPVRVSMRINHTDFVDSRTGSSFSNTSTLKHDSTRQSISEEELSRKNNDLLSPKGNKHSQITRPSTLNITKKLTPPDVQRADSMYFDAPETISVESSYPEDMEEFVDAISNTQNSSVEDFNVTPVLRKSKQKEKQIPSEKSNPEAVIGVELKLSIHVDSGRCVLHPKINQTEATQTINKFMNPLDPLTDIRYNRNGTMAILNNEEEQVNALIKRYKDSLNYTPIASEISVFYIPAVGLQLFYNSKSEVVHPTISISSDNKQTNQKNKQKKSDLYAFILLKKLPKDLLVHPSLIDFVEQALEALPVLTEDIDFEKNSEDQSHDSDESSSLLNESLPVDVIVHINVEPSTLRFVCVPISPVQCLMSLPSVDLIFTTKRSQLDVTSNKIFTPIKGNTSSNDLLDLGQKLQAQHLPEHAQLFAEGGLSVTCIMKEFKISVLHPYGNVAGPIDANHSLTLAVQNVRFNLCRMRQLTMLTEPSNPCDSMTTNNNIKISSICAIGSAEFKYDIRRTQEILAIPIAWYRSSLARRLFLGDDPGLVPPQTADVSTNNLPDFSSSENETHLSIRHLSGVPPIGASSGEMPGSSDLKVHDKNHHRRLSSGDKNKYLAIDTSLTRMRPKLMSTPVPKDDQSKVNFKFDEKSTLPKPSVKESSKSCSLTTSTWQSLLLFAFNLEKVNFEMSMGSAMGITNFNLLEIYSRGHLMMDSLKSRNNQIKVGIKDARFNSQGGIVGGEIGLCGLDIGLHIKEDCNSEPEHRLVGTVGHFEIRIEYMNTNILLGRISCVELSLHDEWQNSVIRQMTRNVVNKQSKMLNLASANSDQACVVILVQGEMKWDQCQFAIGRTTTPDLIKSGNKLTEYFTEQVRESRKSFLSSDRFGFNLRTYSAANASSRTEDTMDFICRVFQRHWQSTYNLALNSFLRLPCYSEDSPEIHSILPPGCLNLGIVGGSLQLIGRSLGVACFAGNFKSAPDWAVFNIQYPTISFETEAQKMTDDKSSEKAKSMETLAYNNFEDFINIRQVLSLELGRQPHFRPHMAYVVKVKRGKDNPANNKIHPKIDEWFFFAFKPADNAITAFLKSNNPQSEKYNVLLTNFSVPNAKQNERHIPFNISRDADILFVIPSISSRLTTDHRQSMVCPQTADESTDSKVELSFHTDFHGVLQLGIIDVPWLPTLINSYIQEKVQDSVDCPDNRASTGSPIVKDMREYIVIHWCLSPECRWLQANQVSVPAFDQILKMVGFRKARTTIPKWLQRGVLDHLDNVLSILVSRVIKLMQEDVQSLKSLDNSLEHN